MKGGNILLEVIKEKISKLKAGLISSFVILISHIEIIYGAEYLYKDIGFLHKYLILSNVGTMVMKYLGYFIYGVVSWILDSCYDAYNSVTKFDFLKNANIKSLLNNIDDLVVWIFFIVFIVAVICKVLKLENPLKVLGNVFICFACVVMFSSLLTLGTNLKNATIKDVQSLLNDGDYKISQTIYTQNTVDCLKSLKKGEVVHLTNKEYDYFSHDEVIDSDYLYDKPSSDPDTGEVSYKELGDGIFFTSVGEERYYRYNTDYWTVNCTILASMIVYLLAMFKHAFLLVDWFNINIFGKIAVGRGIFGVESLGKVGKSVANNLASQVILFSLMSLFSLYMSATLTSDIHWIFKCLLIFAYGMTVFVGSDFLSKGLGLDDNFGKVAASMFAFSRMSRPFKRGIKNLGRRLGHEAGDMVEKGLEKATDKSYDKISDDYQNKMQNAIESDDMKEALQEGRERDDIDNLKEKMQEQEYNDKIKEQAKKELYGDDYKVQEEKEKIQKQIEQGKISDQAKKELYGDDYKYQKVKQDMLDSVDKSYLKDRARKEIYGDDYKQKYIDQQAREIVDRQEAVEREKERRLYGEDSQVDQKQDFTSADEEELSTLLDRLKKGDL